jgi:molybdopterin-binding protein
MNTIDISNDLSRFYARQDMPLLTAREAADRLGISYSTLKQWIYKGSVRTLRTDGGHHRIRDTEVDRLLARQNQMPTPRPRTRRRGVLMAVSGRNRLAGVVEEVRREGLLAQVRLRVGDQSLTAVITRDAVDELGLKRGDEATALIKATEVMVAREVTDEE